MEKPDVLLIGAARSGIAAAKLLNREGYQVTLTDMKEIPEKEELQQAGIAVYDGGHPDFLKEKDYAFVVKNPGIPYRAPLVKFFTEKGTPIYTEIEIAYLFAPQFDYAAVTGTDGKTTTVTLLHEMLKKKNPSAVAAGNIGLPLCEAVLESDGNDTDVALELSNFQLLGIEKFRPHVSTITNLAPDHLDYMDSLDAYYRSKFRIFENQTSGDFFIRNLDDEVIMSYFNDPEKNFFGTPEVTILDFSLNNPKADIHRDETTVWFRNVPLFEIQDLKLVGEFNLGNAMMAASMAYLMGVSVDDIQSVIQSFPGVEHRIEYVGEKDGVRIYNDSKATNTHSAEAALSSFNSDLILLCGGKNKGIDYTVLKDYDSAVKMCFSFGEIRDIFSSVFTRQESVETMEEALDKALEIAKPGDTILLCPATSSFDQFKNYEVRGEIFKDLVRERISK